MNFEHIPVLRDECIAALNIDPAGTYADLTVGGAGHALKIAERLKTGRLFCFDKDADAVAAATERLKACGNVTVIQSDFVDMKARLAEYGVTEINGALMDIGVSSHQLDTPSRGFSYNSDAPLDMRMSGEGIGAREIINTYSAEELAKIFREYGEEAFAWQIAKNIVRAREEAPIETTLELAEIIARSVPAKARRNKNPAKRVFQAVRIAVNDELGRLSTGIDEAAGLLAPKGRLAIITFHSLEARTVRQKFGSLTSGCTCPPDFPVCVCGKTPLFRYVTKKPIEPSAEEIESNRRSKSAKLFALEKID